MRPPFCAQAKAVSIRKQRKVFTPGHSSGGVAGPFGKGVRQSAHWSWIVTEQVEIQGIKLRVAQPDVLNMQWVGQRELMMQLLAAWSILDPRDVPLNPRLLGKPGVGKTTLAYAAAVQLGRPCYLFQATMDTRPEDLIIAPVVGPDQQIQYVASAVVSAMLAGGVVILDEGNRMSEKAWASLAPLLDTRRYVESVIAGVKIQAHPEFRFVATMNEDSSTFELPEYIHSRLQPQIVVEFPDLAEELNILRSNLPHIKDDVLIYVGKFLQAAHAANERYSVRDGINVARYAVKYARAAGCEEKEALRKAIIQVLGKEAERYAS
ncbi:MAG: AAA family ATPase [Candidatus Eremiobacteraeota bacterium]|nr:AAA family ATPase [Candidatus Eremiobacteraeota bacterium]MCW5869446.1 AAA family ATPase [Candidatus Eremiobacteraeota bacterium]